MIVGLAEVAVSRLRAEHAWVEFRVLPTAAILSLLFLGFHLLNAGETAVGLVAFGVLLPQHWLTGNRWFAIGFHAAWDWGQSFFYGVPNSGNFQYA